MVVPAIQYKEEIEHEFKKIQYSDKYLWYTGAIDNYDIEVKTEGDKFAFAIVDKSDDLYGNIVIGYISFRVDWYCSMAYNFSLIKFDITENSPCSTMIMADAIREVIRMVESFNLRRIDFRCVSGNPAEEKYYKIVMKIVKQRRYKFDEMIFHDNIRDYRGKYHDTICYELIRQEAENE